jgi:hypothetical protein
MEDPGELRHVPDWHVHQLTGDRRRTWSLTVTRNWRLTFRIDRAAREIVDLDDEDYHLTFAQKQGGSKLGKLVPKWHTAWDWKALRREVCHHDNAVGSIDDETLHIVCSVSGLGIRLAPIGFLRPVA